MSILTKIGCYLIGWEPSILAQCGEASKRQFRKLLSALFIMMVIWCVIGYCFAERYIGIENLLGKIGVAVAFSAIILCIERVIILTVGKNWLMSAMRILLALCMAFLGASIFDQLIFNNDIQQEISERREIKVIETAEKRALLYDAEIARLTKSNDSIRRCNEELYKEIAAKPTIPAPSESTREEVVGHDENGKPIIKVLRDITTVRVPNPRLEQVRNNDTIIAQNDIKLHGFVQDKLNINNTVRMEIENRPTGFLEELEATITVISQSWVSLLFYCIMFVFLTSLEMFVLTIKMGETKCDYDLIVEHQLRQKEYMFRENEQSLKS
jgi:Domain of unknown function (DUF4407)